jgi:uncharacterized protein (TIGR03067 family)
MKSAIMAALGMSLICSAWADDHKDADRIRGVWTAVAKFDEDGKSKEIKPDDPMHFRFEFTADTMATILKSRSIEGKYKLDPSKSTKEIDVVRKIRGEDTTFQGIYSLDGDKLKVCLAGTGNDRPKAFKAGEGIEFAVEMRKVKK